MCQSLKLIALLLILAKTESSDSSEEKNGFQVFAPASLNFDDIYTNVVPTLKSERYAIMYEMDEKTESDKTTTDVTTRIDESPITSRLVESFYQSETTVPPTAPSPKYILTANMLNESTIAPQPTTTTTEDPDFIIKVVPVKKHYQRGLLDLLFPPKRVESFKEVFDSLRRVLSHTFRR